MMTPKRNYAMPLVLFILLLLPFKSYAEINKGHNLGQLRGAMVGMDVSDNDILEFGQQWNANLIRWQLSWPNPADETDINTYKLWLDSALDRLDNVLTVCRSAGIKVVIDLHSLPGGSNSAEENRLFEKKIYQDTFFEVWEKIARRYKGNTTVWAYDIANEPVEGSVASGIYEWWDLARETALMIRAIDSEVMIVVEPTPFALPYSFDGFVPIGVENIIYSVHLYEPYNFTHQGLDVPSGVSYPGIIDGEMWDKSRLIESLQPVKAFQDKYNVPIYIGEFSAIRWAPGSSAYNYIRDSISIFEDYNWDWSYHAFREWDGWSVEYPSGSFSSTPSTEPTKRETLLKSWYSKNSKAKYFYSLYPDESTRIYTAKNAVLVCHLAVLLDDQSDTQKINYDVIWLLDIPTVRLLPSLAIAAKTDCNEAVLTKYISAIVDSGYRADFNEAEVLLAADNVFRTCNLPVKIPDGEDIPQQFFFDVDWYFKEFDATWNYYVVSDVMENCQTKTVIMPPK